MRGKTLLLSHMKSHFPLYLTAALCLTAANVTYSYFPKVLGDFTDHLQQGGLTRSGVGRYALTLAAIAVAYGLCFGFGQYMNHRLGRMFEFRARNQLFRHFTQLSEAFFSKHGIGKLLSYVMNDVTGVRESIANGLNQLTNASVLLISVITMMTVSDIPALLIVVCVLPLLAIPFIVSGFGPKIRDNSRKVQESLAAMTEAAEEQFEGIKVTKSFATEEIARARFGQTVDRILSSQLSLVRMSSLFQVLLPFTGAVSMAVAIAYGGLLVSRGELSLGNFVALTLYLRMIMNPLRLIGNVINFMQRARASLDRLNHLLSMKPDIYDETGALPLPEDPRSLSIEIRGLTFTYPDAARASLQDIHLRLNPGETLGIVGRTGSGKTTLVKLLLRVYDPPRGTIFIGGRDIRSLRLESLRTRIAYVPQDGFLFSTTLRDNIAFFDRTSELRKVEDASRLADLYDNVIKFPKRFDTELGERGLTLSGGQRQRTSLARGLIKDAPILLLDDSVSAVDSVTETRILSNLQEVRKGKTTLIIAHRISAVKHADRILVLDDGRIAEQGTHEQLLQAGGLYADLHHLQEGDDRDVN
ncbi:ABC transporter ATP-binding protein [Paenibacillus phoenicis]|uniref:ABC transporter ATP-binding protein n=1 Tax=Paenibacillus phoenicis TaxID=554117 RepID=A0ABU5PQQ1_9BACL|nr:ABC transporter ATP-binding protein [Paenibacillus phoenicis]MEA3572117.1 ABC transporter ATP-binding protein [Paenibacillus phoenicis]